MQITNAFATCLNARMPRHPGPRLCKSRASLIECGRRRFECRHRAPCPLLMRQETSFAWMGGRTKWV
eukprot:1223177-Prymnesium_polylepis.1